MQRTELELLRRVEELVGIAAFLDSSLKRGTPPADLRIEAFLSDYFTDVELPAPLKLPRNPISLSRPGLANELAFPEGGDQFANDILSSYRVKNGSLHNPKSDRRTTKGTFHVAEGGLPIPGDKRAVPKEAFAAMFREALLPPDDLLVVPFTASRPEPVHSFVSLL